MYFYILRIEYSIIYLKLIKSSINITNVKVQSVHICPTLIIRFAFFLIFGQSYAKTHQRSSEQSQFFQPSLLPSFDVLEAMQGCVVVVQLLQSSGARSVTPDQLHLYNYLFGLIAYYYGQCVYLFFFKCSLVQLVLIGV